jgi:hypothetical protein
VVAGRSSCWSTRQPDAHLGGAGSRPTAPRDQRYEWTYLFGAVCPARGVGAGLVLPYGNLEAMNLHLQEISRWVTQEAFAVLTLDGAGWHQKGDRLVIPDAIGLLHLPPYSPELNPAENIWEFLRQNDLSNRVYATYEAVVDACCGLEQAYGCTRTHPIDCHTRICQNGRLMSPLVLLVIVARQAVRSSDLRNAARTGRRARHR